jgi:RNA ligase (TIGR02306 family)
MKETHRVEVVRITENSIETHPNADSLMVIKPFGNNGYRVVARKVDWKPGDLAAYILPDTLVPLDRQEFSFLTSLGRTPFDVKGREFHLIRVVRLRGQYSQGLLVKAPEDAVVGQDVAEYYETVHYEPPVKESKNTSKATTHGSAAEKAPSINPPTYDLASMRRHADAFVAGEKVWVTEKVHGANARYTCEDRGLFSFSFRRKQVSIRVGSRVLTWGRYTGLKFTKLPEYARYMRVGSRTQWKKPDPRDIWWRALEATPQISEFCKQFPSHTLYGEVYGDVQDLDYAVPVGQVRFAAFDVLTPDHQWWAPAKFVYIMARYEIPTVPVIGAMPFDLEKVLQEAEGESILQRQNRIVFGSEGKPHVREGVVVKPAEERHDGRVGRVALKLVGNGYLER